MRVCLSLGLRTYPYRCCTPEREVHIAVADLVDEAEEANEREPGMSEQEILATTPIRVIAGSETTGSALSGLLFYLSQNPLAYDLPFQELDPHFLARADITFRSTALL